ncbi:MAG: hypothetical protein JWR11_6016, partial [Mycobacterium sp.]|nr:hypothetical protein [Mycobacterium sp.]
MTHPSRGTELVAPAEIDTSTRERILA